MAPPCRLPGLAALVLAAALLSTSEARVYRLDGLPGPRNGTLHGRCRFHVSSGGAPAEVELAGVSVQLDTTKGKREKQPIPTQGMSLLIAMLPMTEFLNMTDSNRNSSLCTKGQQLGLGASEGVVTQVTPVGGTPLDVSLKLPRGGWYMLAVVNCAGVVLPTTLSGSFAVRNKWGFLDGVDYWRVHVYGSALVLSVVCVLIYCVVLARQGQRVRDAQYSCLVLATLGLAEAAVQCDGLYRENINGVLAWGRMGDGLYLVKFAYGLVLLLSVVQGAGLTVPSLEWPAFWRCCGVAGAYLAVVVPKVSLFTAGPHLSTVSSLDLIQVALPVLIVVCAALCWAVASLGGTLVELRALGDPRALEACRRLAMLLLFLSASSVAALVGQVLSALAARDTDAVWQHALWNDALASGAFFVVLCVLMRLSMEDFVGEVSPVPHKDVNEDPADRFSDDEDEEAVLYTGKPAPQSIGAIAAAE